MKEYEYDLFEVSCDEDNTKADLNDWAKEGWRLICSYCGGRWLIMEREKKVCKRCGK